MSRGGYQVSGVRCQKAGSGEQGALGRADYGDCQSSMDNSCTRLNSMVLWVTSAAAAGDGGDHCVVWADWLAGARQVGSDRGVVAGGRVVERERLVFRFKFIDKPEVIGPAI